MEFAIGSEISILDANRHVAIRWLKMSNSAVTIKGACDDQLCGPVKASVDNKNQFIAEKTTNLLVDEYAARHKDTS